MILTERVTLFGKIMDSPAFELRPSHDPSQNSSTAMKVDGKLVNDLERTLKEMYLEQQKNEAASASTNIDDNAGKQQKKEHYPNTRIWLANKLKGELITEVSEQTKSNRKARVSLKKKTHVIPDLTLG